MAIKLIADSACDLSRELIEATGIHIIPIIIIKGSEIFRDDVDIFRKDIFDYYRNENKLCSTSALSEYDYVKEFEQFASDYTSVIYICLGSRFSSMYTNAVKAASHFKNVYVVDSANLTTGYGMLVMRTADYIKMGLGLGEILPLIESVKPRIMTSFIVDDVTYLAKGGRCSSAAALGANVLKLKPCISVIDGEMKVTKKYKGSLEKCVTDYIGDKLKDIEAIADHRIFLSYSEVDEEVLEAARNKIRSYGYFQKVNETHTGGTVCCHCGPGTLGIIYLNKQTL